MNSRSRKQRAICDCKGFLQVLFRRLHNWGLFWGTCQVSARPVWRELELVHRGPSVDQIARPNLVKTVLTVETSANSLMV